MEHRSDNYEMSYVQGYQYSPWYNQQFQSYGQAVQSWPQTHSGWDQPQGHVGAHLRQGFPRRPDGGTPVNSHVNSHVNRTTMAIAEMQRGVGSAGKGKGADACPQPRPSRRSSGKQQDSAAAGKGQGSASSSSAAAGKGQGKPGTPMTTSPLRNPYDSRASLRAPPPPHKTPQPRTIPTLAGARPVCTCGFSEWRGKFAEIRTNSDETLLDFWRDLGWVVNPAQRCSSTWDFEALEGPRLLSLVVAAYQIETKLGSSAASRLALHRCHKGPYTLYEIALTLCAETSLSDRLAAIAQKMLYQTLRCDHWSSADDSNTGWTFLDRLVQCGANGLSHESGQMKACLETIHEAGQIVRDKATESTIVHTPVHTPLHVFCRGQRTTGGRAYVAAWLIKHWPLALLMKGCKCKECKPSCLWPALYIDFASVEQPGSWVCAFAQGYLRCLDLYPSKVERMMQLPEFQQLLDSMLNIGLSRYRHGEDPSVDSARHALGMLRILQASPTVDIPRAWEEVAQLHKCRRHAFALNGLVKSCSLASESLTRLELEAKFHESSAMLEEHRRDSQAEIGRLESELAAARHDLELREQQLQALRDVAVSSQSASVPAVSSSGAGSRPLGNIGNGGGGVGLAAADGSGQSSAADVIAAVRRRRLVDVGDLHSLPDDVIQGVQSMQASLSRAVERLAKDLYASDAHALHELLQNADDCRYAADKEPSMRFLLGDVNGSTFFAAESNELGFQEADVWALCDINASTKSVNANAAIGQKGIGWKSLFLLSDAPHVLSGDFSFKFDIAGPLGLLGYVTPTWLSVDELAMLPKEVISSWHDGKTVFYVPLRDAAARLELEAELRQLCNSSEDPRCFPPPLATAILFFRKLRHLFVKVQGDNGCSVSFSIRPHQTDQHYVYLHREAAGHEGQHGLSYLFFIHGMETPDGAIQLAFLLPQEDIQFSRKGSEADEPADGAELSLAWVFTFLPVRCIGFKFAVQAPFHLTASRGDIHNTSAKNLRLRSSIPAAFEAAVSEESSTCEHVGRKPYLAEAALMLLATDVVDVWWRPVREHIVERISKNMLCIPVEPFGVARMTEALLRGPSWSKAHQLSRFLSPQLLYDSCGLHFVREDASSVSPDQLRRLGCASFDIQTALQCLRHEWLQAQMKVTQGGSSFEDYCKALYEFLLSELIKEDGANAKVSASELLDQIMNVPLFPTVGRKVISLEARLFRNFCPKVPHAWQDHLAMHGILQVLHQSIRSSTSSGVKTFLDKLCIEDLTLEDIVERILHMMGKACHNEVTNVAHAIGLWSAAISCLKQYWVERGEVPCLDIASSSYTSQVVLDHLWVPGLTLKEITQLPDESGTLRPPSQLDCPTLFGVACPLPPELCSQIASLAGVDLPLEATRRVHNEVMAAESSPQSGGSPLGHLECEAFLYDIGVKPMPLFSRESQVVSIALGKLFGAGRFWAALLESPKAAHYVMRRLQGATNYEIEWLRSLDVNEGVCMKSLFLKSEFVKHGGRFLSYIDIPLSVPETVQSTEMTCKDGETSVHDNVARALRALGMHLEVSLDSLILVWHHLMCPWRPADSTLRCTSCEVYADLFQTIVHKFTGKCYFQLGSVYVPGEDLVDLGRCIWEEHAEPAFVKLAGKVALEPHYGRYGDSQRQFFMQVARVPEKMVCKDFRIALGALFEQVEAATALLAMGTSGDRASNAGAPEGGWAFSNPLELPNRVHGLAKTIYLEIAACLAVEEQESLQSRVKPLPENMIRALESFVARSLGGTRTMTEVVRWFINEFGGTPVNLHESLARSSEFEVFEEEDGPGRQHWCLRPRRGATDLFGERMAAHRCFAESRLIAVPEYKRKLPGGAPVATIKRLYSGEAYWEVATQLQQCQCAAWALSQHYPPELYSFFTTVGVTPTLTVEEFGKRLAEKAQELDRPAQPSPEGEDNPSAGPEHAFHSDGYNLGDFIGGDGDAQFLNELLQNGVDANDLGTLTESFLQRRNAVADPGTAAASAMDLVRNGNARDWGRFGGTLDLDDEPSEAMMHEPQRSVQRTLHFVTSVRGLLLWAYEPRDSPPLAHAERCASVLAHVAEHVYDFPADRVHLVDGKGNDDPEFCTGLFSAMYPGALFVELPVQHDDGSADGAEDWPLSMSHRDWAVTELAHQLAHTAGHRTHSLRFCKVLERLLAPTERLNRSTIAGL